MVIHVMDAPQGAAMRIQLDAMIAVLLPVDEAAADARDEDVRHLIASLYEARAAAHAVETRAQERKPYLGVKLAKN